jgi:hypothetical protein
MRQGPVAQGEYKAIQYRWRKHCKYSCHIIVISCYFLFMAHSSSHWSTCPGLYIYIFGFTTLRTSDDRDGGNCGWVKMYMYNMSTSNERNWGKDSPEHLPCQVANAKYAKSFQFQWHQGWLGLLDSNFAQYRAIRHPTRSNKSESSKRFRSTSYPFSRLPKVPSLALIVFVSLSI